MGTLLKGAEQTPRRRIERKSTRWKRINKEGGTRNHTGSLKGRPRRECPNKIINDRYRLEKLPYSNRKPLYGTGRKAEGSFFLSQVGIPTLEAP